MLQCSAPVNEANKVIAGGITAQQHVVKIDGHRELLVPADFNLAQRTHLADATRCGQRIGNMRERTDGV